MGEIHAGKKKNDKDASFFVLFTAQVNKEWRRHNSFCLSRSKVHIGPVPDYLKKLLVLVLLSNSNVTNINK